MSQRSLLEVNHDHAPGPSDAELLTWARQLTGYIRSGDERYLPRGIQLKHRRHHTEPDRSWLPPRPRVSPR